MLMVGSDGERVVIHCSVCKKRVETFKKYIFCGRCKIVTTLEEEMQYQKSYYKKDDNDVDNNSTKNSEY